LIKERLRALRRFFGRLRPDRKNKKRDAVFYINGASTLPPPLTREEEERCFEEIRRGNEAARDLLIVHNLRLVVYIAKKFESPAAGTEDLISIGTIGLIKAVKTFCPEKNIKLATYASRCVENEILMFLRKTSNRGTEISIDEPLNVDWDGNELLLSDILSTGENTVSEDLEREDEIRCLMRCISRLSEREQKIICMRFGLCGSREYTQKEVADILGISQSYISRIEKKIISDLKRNIEKESSIA
jgi:RNA polymerase sporulation-specific sigma factor